MKYIKFNGIKVERYVKQSSVALLICIDYIHGKMNKSNSCPFIHGFD